MRSARFNPLGALASTLAAAWTRRADTTAEDAHSALIAASGLFDAAFYLSTNPDVAAAGADPVVHFCTDGWREGRRPNLYFDPVRYMAVELGGASDVNPLVHYIRGGEASGCRPSEGFDPTWYRDVADVAPGTLALAALLAHRRAQGLAPDEVSDLSFWDDRRAIAASGTFDVNYYLINNPDVREAGRDPIFHFDRDGWREGRRPNLYFDPLWYAARYLGDPPAGNPLAHYVRGGEAAGCRPSCVFEPDWYRAAYGVPRRQLALAHFLEHRRSQKVAPNSHFDLAYYLARHGAEIGPNRDPFAHLLRCGVARDLDPSARFDSAAYRRAAMAGAPDQVPLVHFLDGRARVSAARERQARQSGGVRAP